MTKKQIELTYTTKEKRLVEVEFPIYRAHRFYPDYGPNSTIYTRIDEDLSAIHIDVYEDGLKAEIEIEEDFSFDNNDTDYNLGLGEYASNEAEFRAALDTVRALEHRVYQVLERERLTGLITPAKDN